ncbi:ABC transporter permease subunit [uncultured Parolsenella sp.]|uniref:methionine ABC transporter permease n=1 Tax=uncultured Parolsenella sp. TaxID=2083008 RepID=UPI0027D9363A|nr:ABC transporter permease subunit [uncultured Parolsenella sp.]
MGISAFLDKYSELLVQGTIDTTVMVLASTIGAYVIGIVVGTLLTVLSPTGLRPNRVAYAILGWIVNMARSLPFIILLVFLIPTTRLVVGTTLGVPAAVFPLIMSAGPYVARMVESSEAEVDRGLIEAAESMGASTWEIITKVYLREGLPSLLRGLPIVIITILGYTAMAGTVGAGGLGDIAIRYGYQRYQDDVMLATIVILIVMVQVIQSLCNLLVRICDKRMRS